MSKWELQLLAGGAALVGAFLLILVIKLCNLHSKGEAGVVPYVRQGDGNNSSSNNGAISMISSSRKGTVPVQAFEWKDQPKLMSEALENGWSAFALSVATVHHNRQAVTTWEVGSGTELMQIIKFNPGLPLNEVSTKTAQFMKCRLPLPGPYLGCYSYPQEAYFEVAVLSARSSDVGKQSTVNPSKLFVGIGLVAGANSSFGDVGSVSYCSNGQVLLNGVVYTGEHFSNRPWLQSSKHTTVVGCGFNPKLRKVYFTLNGDVTCQVNCSSCEEFAYPLHPVVVSNYEQVVVVNLGQSMFEFLPENCTRVSDPGNLRPPASSRFSFPKVQYDSGDLFSMGRPDDDFSPALSQELSRPAPSEAESELFEIVLDATH